jgi:hypothetical protein
LIECPIGTEGAATGSPMDRGQAQLDAFTSGLVIDVALERARDLP